MGKRFVVAVDVSTSLSSIVPGTSISTAVAAAAITMIFARSEADTHVLAYSEGAVVPCSVSADMTLAQATFELVKIPSGSTDCTLPITWATENGKAVDVFIVLTNNPLWTFTASPVESLKKHRQVRSFILSCVSGERMLLFFFFKRIFLDFFLFKDSIAGQGQEMRGDMKKWAAAQIRTPGRCNED